MTDALIEAKYGRRNIAQLWDDYYRLSGELNCIHDPCYRAPEDLELKREELKYVSSLIKFLWSRADSITLGEIVRP